jgi:tetratricopeptide (TPR) repeat protein
MKKVVIALMVVLISISPLFRGLFFEYETYMFMAALALLCIIYFFIKIFKRESIRINRLCVTAGMLVLAGTCFSFANAMNVRATLEALFFHMVLLVLFIILYDYYYGRKLQFMKAVMLPSVAVGAFAGFVGMVALTGRFNVLQVTILANRVGSTFQYANTAAVYFLICFVFAITLSNVLENIFLRSIVIGLGSVSLFAFFMTGSRGGFLTAVLILPALIMIQPSGMKLRTLAAMVCPAIPVFAVMKSFNMAVAAKINILTAAFIVASFLISAVIYFITDAIMKAVAGKLHFNVSKKTKLLLTGIFASALVLVLVVAVIFRQGFVQVLPPVMAGRLERLFSMGWSDNTIQIRLAYYKDAIKLLSSHWLFGLGKDGWKALFQSVQDYGYIANDAHSHYLQVFVDHGILTFLAYTGLVVISAVGLLRSYLKSADRLSRACTAGMLCGFAALAAHSAFDFDMSYASMVLLLWVMFALSAVVSRDEARQEAAASGNARADVVAQGKKASVLGIALVSVCSLLFSMSALYFTAAYFGQRAQEYVRTKNYSHAVIYYREANRLDPSNPKYTFELTKIYHYFGRNVADSRDREIWLEKAREAGEISVNGYKGYPLYMKKLVKVYLDSGMQLEALEIARELPYYQKYNAEVYELLARSYIDAAAYYEKNGDIAKAKELLARCIAIDQDPHLRRSVVERPDEIDSPEVLARYRHSDELAGYLSEAEEFYEKLK